MGQHSMRSWPRKTHSEPVSENMSSVFQCSDRFTPLPLGSRCAYNCLSGLTAHSGHALVEQLPQIEQKESFEQSWLETIGNAKGVAISRTVGERASHIFHCDTVNPKICWSYKAV